MPLMTIGTGRALLQPPAVVEVAATWSTTDKSSGCVLSNGNKTATKQAPPPFEEIFVRGDGYMTGSDKVYVEFVVTNVVTSFYIGFAENDGITTTLINDNDSFAIRGDGQYGGNSITAVLGASFADGDRGCIAVDFGNKRAWFRKAAGNWNNSGTADPATNTEGFDISFINEDVTIAYQGNGNDSSLTVHCDTASWVHTAPSGFGELTV